MASDKVDLDISHDIRVNFFSQLRKWTHPIFVVNKETSREICVGSGIAIKVFGHYLVATAAHVIENGEHDYRIGFSTKDSTFRLDQSPAIVKTTYDRKKDIGFLEVDVSGREDMDDFFIDYQRLGKVDSSTEDAIVIGYPSASVNSQEKKILAYQFETEMVDEKSRLPVDEERPIVAGVDFFVGYRENVLIQTYESCGIAKSTDYRGSNLNPHGLSGGGVWGSHYTSKGEAGIITPAYVLLGIQASFYLSRRLLRATKFEHWVSLVAENYPDIKKKLSKRVRR